MNAEAGGQRRVLVMGASSQIGVFLLPRLLEQGWRVDAVSRQARLSAHGDGLQWWSWDLAVESCPDRIGPISTVIHLAPLPWLPRHLPELVERGASRIVAMSSTSRLTKADSASPYERSVAASLAQAEDDLASVCDRLGVAWTVFRPTMIYGAGQDRSIHTIARFIRIFRFFPLVDHGRGLRQPVHADDLAQACMAAMEADTADGRVFELAGGERLSYREMVGRVFRSQGIRPRFLPVPGSLLRGLLRLARRLPGHGYLTPEMVDRISGDLCFDITAAREAFGYAPRAFMPGGRYDAADEVNE